MDLTRQVPRATLNIMPLSKEDMSRKFAIATAAAKKGGFVSFKKGSAGAEKRKHIAEAVGLRLGMKKK